MPFVALHSIEREKTVKYFSTILYFCLALASDAAFAEPCKESQSLNNLKMKVCLSKRLPTDVGYSGFEITYVNISERLIFLRIEDDAFRRFEMSLRQDKIDLTERPLSDDDCFPMPT